jgi:hypothetical protein
MFLMRNGITNEFLKFWQLRDMVDIVVTFWWNVGVPHRISSRLTYSWWNPSWFVVPKLHTMYVSLNTLLSRCLCSKNLYWCSKTLFKIFNTVMSIANNVLLLSMQLFVNNYIVWWSGSDVLWVLNFNMSFLLIYRNFTVFWLVLGNCLGVLGWDNAL